MTPAGYFSFTLLGTFAIYLWTRPARTTWLWLLPIAVLMRLACAKAMAGLENYFGAAWFSWGLFLGLASLLVLLIQAVFARGAERRRYIHTFFAASIFPLWGLAVVAYFPVNVRLYPKTLDAFLLAFDGSLGFQPSFALGRMAARNHALWNWTTVVYHAVPFVASVLYASHRMRKRQTVPVLPLLLSFMIVGVMQYGIYPAIGPGIAFSRFYPWSSPPLREILLQPMIVPAAPRNCMPSLHFGTALLVWWNSRIWPAWGRAAALLFLLATAFATLATGQHYLVDLVVAFPFALAFQAFWTRTVPLRLKARSVALAVGISVNAVWLVMLRYQIPVFEKSAIGTWMAVVLTVGCSLLLEVNLTAVRRSEEKLHADGDRVACSAQAGQI